MKPAIKIENLSKQYRLGTVGTGTFASDVNRWWHTVRGKEDPYLKIGETNDRTSKGESEFVWALQNIDFEVMPGEVLGIIGKNGAGKSTLLKLLSRVTAPTTGTIRARGRIASLLEVGTGFHPELTGGENVFLNGAIMGMTRQEIRSKYDEIVDFAGCERYIDTPVKRYSSGMYVRLAFAVAAHLEPEILIVDEVLAVGDAEFQKKAIGKMKDVTKGEGRTVLFVSHNMASVKSLCHNGIVLKNGEKVFSGSSEESVSYYLKDGANGSGNLKIFKNVFKEGIFKLNIIKIKNKSRTVEQTIVEDDVINIITEIDILKNPEKYHVTYHLFNELGEVLFSFSHSRFDVNLNKGTNIIACEIPKKFLHPGNYTLKFLFIENKKNAIYTDDNIMDFTVVNGRRNIGVFMGKEPGYVIPNFKWQKLN